MGDAWHDHGLVFSANNGEPIHLRNLTARRFKPLLQQVGLPMIRLYDLRHTCASLLLLDGRHPKVVSERLGHASTAITMDLHSHVVETLQDDATNRLGKMLFRVDDDAQQSNGDQNKKPPSAPDSSKVRKTRRGLKFNGAAGRNRTADTRIFSPLLYRLSYRGMLPWRSELPTILNGGRNRVRTCDPLLVRQVLYR